MRVWSGTSGFAYREWKGSFYPADAADDQLLSHYGARLDAVEINSTFYRMPRSSDLERWAGMVPEEFRFVLKASRRITHQSRLSKCEDSVAYLWKQARVLGARLGPVLFQTPPNFRLNIDRLRGFLDCLPGDMRAAFEFRHPSWEHDEVRAALGERDHALCIADDDEGDGDEPRPPPPLESISSWGYARLRREAYSADDLRSWLQRFAEAGYSEVFCFFKHEDGPGGPEAAAALSKLAQDREE